MHDRHSPSARRAGLCRGRTVCRGLAVTVLTLSLLSTGHARPLEPTESETAVQTVASEATHELAEALPSWVEPERVTSSLQLAVTMLLLGLVPALLMLTTCYLRILVVLGLLRHAFGSPQILPAQATTSLALFCTFLIMWPTWQDAYQRATTSSEKTETAQDADWMQRFELAAQPIRGFMSRQIEATGNSDQVLLFAKYAQLSSMPQSYDEVPLRVLFPAFVVSELKTAFLMGFQIYLPFLVIDLVVSAVTTSMGMFMLPPSMIAMPLKLLMFVLADGWEMVVGMLMKSFS